MMVSNRNLLFINNSEPRISEAYWQPLDDGLKGVSDNRPPFEKSSEKSMVEILPNKKTSSSYGLCEKPTFLIPLRQKGEPPSTAFSGHFSLEWCCDPNSFETNVLLLKICPKKW